MNNFIRGPTDADEDSGAKYGACSIVTITCCWVPPSAPPSNGASRGRGRGRGGRGSRGGVTKPSQRRPIYVTPGNDKEAVAARKLELAHPDSKRWTNDVDESGPECPRREHFTREWVTEHQQWWNRPIKIILNVQPGETRDPRRVTRDPRDPRNKIERRLVGNKIAVECLPSHTIGYLKWLAAAKLGTTAEKLFIKKRWNTYGNNMRIHDTVNSLIEHERAGKFDLGSLGDIMTDKEMTFDEELGLAMSLDLHWGP